VFAKPTVEQLKQRFSYHAPKGDQAQRYGEIRDKLLEAAIYIVERTPVSPEQTRALNKLDEAMMIFNAAIARNE
jgi:type IV secretory pathway VirB4 component